MFNKQETSDSEHGQMDWLALIPTRAVFALICELFSPNPLPDSLRTNDYTIQENGLSRCYLRLLIRYTV